MSNPGFITTENDLGAFPISTGPASGGGLLPAFFGNSAAMRAAAGLSGPGSYGAFDASDSMGFSLDAYLPDGSMLARYLVSQGLVDPSEQAGVSATYPGLAGALQAEATTGASGLPLFGMPSPGTLGSFGFMVDPAQQQQLEQALSRRASGTTPRPWPWD